MGRAATTGSLLAALLLIVQCAGAEVVPKIAPADPTPTLVIDQFGYRPEGEKILIIRTPVRGFDAGTGGGHGATSRSGVIVGLVPKRFISLTAIPRCARALRGRGLTGRSRSTNDDMAELTACSRHKPIRRIGKPDHAPPAFRRPRGGVERSETAVSDN